MFKHRQTSRQIITVRSLILYFENFNFKIKSILDDRRLIVDI